MRWMMTELAWGWLRYQPESELSQWYRRGLAKVTSGCAKWGSWRWRRKLLIALWKYVEGGEAPAGAVVVGWDNKPRFKGGRSRGEKKAS